MGGVIFVIIKRFNSTSFVTERKEPLQCLANHIDPGDIRDSRIRDDVFFELANVTRPGPNLSLTKRGTRWSYDRTLENLNLTYYWYDIP